MGDALIKIYQGRTQKFEEGGGRNFERPIYRPKSGEDQKEVSTSFDVQFTARNQVKTKKKGLHAFRRPISQVKTTKKRFSRPQLIFQRWGGGDLSGSPHGYAPVYCSLN